MFKGFAVLLSLQAIGELITLWLHLPLPGSVLGMLLLLFGLRFGLIELEWVKDAAELLLSNLSLLFVPAGVGIMVYAELIARQWVPLVLATLLSTLAVLAITGWVAQWLTKSSRPGVK